MPESLPELEPATPPAPRAPFPGFWGAVGLVVLVLVLANVIAGVTVVAAALMSGRGLDGLRNMPDMAALGIWTNSLAFGVVVWLGWRWSRRPLAAVFPLRVPAWGDWPPFLLSLAGGLLVLNEVTTLVTRVLPVPEWVRQIFESYLGGSTGVTAFVFLVVVAPITEELLFRGLILRGFLPRYGLGWACFLSGMLFGFMHLLPWQILPAFGLGILFGWWSALAGSLWPSLVAHALTNAAAYITESGARPEEMFRPQSQPLWLTLAGVAALALGVAWTRRRFRERGAAAIPSEERSFS